MSEKEINLSDVHKPQPRPASAPAQQFDQSINAISILDEILNKNVDNFIPWEDITLPSKGIYYDNKIPGGLIQVRAMDIQVEKIMSTQRLMQSGQAFDMLYNKCVRLPDGFDSADLLSSDRNFLLYVIRGMTYGNLYEFAITCPNCDAGSTHTYDLNDLSSTIKPPNPGIGNEPFLINLPYMSKMSNSDFGVKIKFPRGRDTNAMLNRQRFNKRADNMVKGKKDRQSSIKIIVDETLTQNINLLIVAISINGADIVDRDKIGRLVEKLHAEDSSEIRNYIRENAPGIDTNITIECPSCNFEINTDLPITENFFRRKSQ